MALIDNKITDGDISTYGVVSAPDRLTGTANENKQVFDNLIKQAIKVKMNELINDLIAATAAGELGAKAPSGLSGSNIQAVLQSLKTYVDNTKVAKEPGKGLSENDYTDADKALVAQIPDKAGTDNVLTKDNVTPFEPTGEYNPCTKKYADNLAFQSGNVTSVFGRGGAVVAQEGDYTPQQVGAEPAFSVLPVSKGGTGQTTLAAARNAMGLGNTTGALPVANGGTGQTSLALVTVGTAVTAQGVKVANYGTPVELGQYVDLHLVGSENDYDIRLYINPSNNMFFIANANDTTHQGYAVTNPGNNLYSVQKITQAAYNQLNPPDPYTAYFIVG